MNPSDNIIDEKGFSFLETLFVISILSILVAAAAFRGSSIYQNAILDYETQMLVSDLKLLQQMCRTSTYKQTNFPMKEKPPFNIDIDMDSDAYFMRRIDLYGKSFRRHYFPSYISAELTHLSYLSFRPDGDTVGRQMGSIRLSWIGRWSLTRKIVLDAAGRIRVDR